MPLPIERVHVEQFRGLRGVSLNDCGRLNLLVGGNDAGKTSALEALLLLSDPFDARNWDLAAESRVLRSSPEERVELIDGLFPVGAPDRKILMVREGPRRCAMDAQATPIDRLATDPGAKDAHERGLEIAVLAKGTGSDLYHGELTFWSRERARQVGVIPDALSCAFTDAVDHFADPSRSVSRAMLEGRGEALLKLVRHVEPRLERLDVLAPEGLSRVYGVIAGRPVLWSHFGAGVQRALTYGLDLIRASGGVLLIDELETGIHWTALRDVCTWLARSANELDVQVFATTHSVETIDALIEASRGDADELVLFHLERSNGMVSVTRYGEELLSRVRFERGLEVR